MRENIFMPKKYFFTKIFIIYSFIDDCYELISYDRGVAQLGSAGALGAYLFTNENYCNNSFSYFYYKLKSEGKRQNFISARAIKAPALLKNF